MALIVQKYGGTSMGSIDRIANVARRVKSFVADGHQVVVVVSAMSGETNRLIDLAKEMHADPDLRELDSIISTGEQVSSGLLAIALKAFDQPAKSYAGHQIKLKTDKAHSKARIEEIDSEKLMTDVKAGIVPVVAGFQGVDDEGNITTLGRGGSDTTAVALAAALKADECQIYTDVDGVYTTDPRVDPNARRLPKITFEEMVEMASLGSKVLQIRSVEFAGKYHVPLRVLSSFIDDNNQPGTLITLEDETAMEKPIIAGVAFSRDEAKIQILGVKDSPGVAYQILGPVADANIDVDLIIQNASVDGCTDFAFTVARGDRVKVVELLNQSLDKIGGREIVTDNTISKVSIVGVGMRSHPGVASKMFKALADEHINIEMIGTSEIKVSVVVQEHELEKAVRCLHKAFELDKISAEEVKG